jgi:polyvinyl alcohol dehydrogenase (cytochrome)
MRARVSFLWARLVGHGDDPGGIQWGTAVDGERIYAAIGHNTRRDPYVIASDPPQTVTGGSWAALDPSDGHILWQIPDPCWTIDPRGAPTSRR